MLTFYKYDDDRYTRLYFEKQSDEIQFICADFAGDIETSEALTVGSSTVTAYDSNDVDVSSTIISGALAAVGTQAMKIKIQAGTDGEKYKLTFKAITDAGETKELDIYMIINDI